MTQYVADFADMDGNGTPDFAKLKEVADGVYMRAAHGNRPDPTYATLAPLARAAGLRVGAYGILEWWRGAPAITAQSSALIASVGKPDPTDLPTSLDVEFGDGLPSHLTPREALEDAEEYARAVIAALGHAACYTSRGQMFECLGDPQSAALASCSGWFKTGYYEQLHRPFNPKSQGPVVLPLAWRALGSAGAWLQQFQGDCWGFGGLKQCDVSAHLPLAIGEKSERARWVQAIVGADADGDFGPKSEAALRAFQAARNLPATGRVDLDTWVALCRTAR
jgi:peptidoglycan hydrolase-like protein with peptidoglycan-binding domain